MSDMTYCSWTHKLNSEQWIAFYKHIYLKGSFFVNFKWSSLWKTSSGSCKSSALLLLFHVINNMLYFMLCKLCFQSLFSFRMGNMNTTNALLVDMVVCHCLESLVSVCWRLEHEQNMDTWTRIIPLATH